MTKLLQTTLVCASLLLLAPAAGAQTRDSAPPPLAVGSMAPDFTLPGATRFGVLRDKIQLSDFRGKTVVLAFFYQARTKG